MSVSELGRRRCSVAVLPAHVGFSDDDDFETEVVGESFRQAPLLALNARVDTDLLGRRTFVARLRAEPQNPRDSTAVAVHAADSDDHLGYLSRAVAAAYHDSVLQRGHVEVSAILCGGSERKPLLGVWLDLTAANRTLGIEPTVRVSQGLAAFTAESLRSAMPEKRFIGSAQILMASRSPSASIGLAAQNGTYASFLAWRAGSLPTGVSSRARHCSSVIGSDATLMPWSTGPYARFTSAC